MNQETNTPNSSHAKIIARYLTILILALTSLATLTAQEHTLTIVIEGDGTVDVDGEEYTDPLTIDNGTEVTIEAEADAGWSFSSWSDDASGSENPLVVEMDDDKTITANFTQDSYNLTVNTDGDGSVTRDPDQGSYLSGTEVTIEAEADAGWSFSSWSGDASGSENPLVVEMDENKNITAEFSVIPPTAGLSGTAAICIGSSTELTVELTGMGPWTVVYSDGNGEIVEEIDSSPHEISVEPTTSTTYSLISVEDNFGNPGDVSGTADITVVDLPEANAGPDASICVNSSHSLNGASASNFGSIEWTTSGDGTFNDPTALNPTYTPASTDGGETIILTITVSGTGECDEETDSDDMKLTVDPLPVGGTVTGENDMILLNQSTGTLTLDNYSGTIVKWQRSFNTGDWTDITNEEVTYSETPGATGSYRYQVIVESGLCGTATSGLFEVFVINSPVIVSSQYDSSTGELILTGQYFKTDQPVDVSKLALSNDDNTFEFASSGLTSGGNPVSPTQAVINVDERDRPYLNKVLDKNGTFSAANNFYNLYAGENWNGLAYEDPTTTVAVVDHDPPSLLSATYNFETKELDVTAAGLVAWDTGKDIDASDFTIAGKDGADHTLSASDDVDVLSDTRFIINLSAADQNQVEQLLDIMGTEASTGHTYLLTADNGWNQHVHPGYNIAETDGIVIEARDVPNQPPVASELQILGTLIIGNTVEAGYEYFDLEDDAEGDSQFRWFRADDEAGAGEEEISGETEVFYTLTEDDINKFLAFEVTPHAVSGTSPGDPVKSDFFEVLNTPPFATGVEITGVPEIGGTVVGSYNYSDLEGDAEGDSQYRWYRADDGLGDGSALIDGATNLEYTLTNDDATRYIAFEVTPVAAAGASPGEPVKSDWLAVLNAPPVAGNLTIDGVPDVGETITALYDYFDPEGDPEGESEFQWFRADESDGTGEVELDGETEVTYLVREDDIDKFLAFEVTPVALEGASPGETVRSGWFPVGVPVPDAVLEGTQTICFGQSAELTLSLTGVGPWLVEYTDGEEVLQLEGITSSPHTFEVSPLEDTEYSLVSVKDNFGTDGNVTGTAMVTVTPLPEGGEVTGPASFILLSQSTGTLTLSGETGAVVRWEKRVNEGSWTEVGNTEKTYSEVPSSIGTWEYRAVVESGECGTDESEPHEIVVANSPVINTVTYNAANGRLSLFGQYMDPGKDINVTKLTVSNGTDNYRFTTLTANVKPVSSTQAVIQTEGKARAFMNWIFNNDGPISRDELNYNISADADWNGPALEDPVTPVTVSNHVPPSIISATYNRIDGVLDVTAQGLVAAENVTDIDASKLVLTGKDGDSHTLSVSSDVDVLSDKRFVVIITDKDKEEVDLIIDIEGLFASSGDSYNLGAEKGWNRSAHPDNDVEDLDDNPVRAQEIENRPPEALNVVIDGDIFIGNTITGDYDYYDLEGDPEGESEYAWYRADDAGGAGAEKIAGAELITYTVTLEDAAKYLAFEVTPVALAGAPEGEPVRSDWGQVENAPPSVSDVELTGLFEVCKVLTANYTYFDPEGDPEGETVIRWLRSDDDEGTNEEEIHTGPDYTLTLEDEGKYIKIEVTPVASEGLAEGNPVESGYYGPVENTLPTVELSGPGLFCQGSSVELVFELTGYKPWVVYYTDGNSEYSFTANSSPHVLTVNAAGTYQVTAVVDSDGCEGVELGDELVLNTSPTIDLINGYAEIFDNGQGGWFSGTLSENQLNSWNYGTANDVFTSASAGQNFWYISDPVTGFAEQSFVSGPCFDFTDTERPMIIIDLWEEFGSLDDGAVLQYSLDNGGTWSNIGSVGTGINWYNSDQVGGLSEELSDGWTFTGDTGTGQGWQEARHDLDILSGNSFVRLRLVYGTDGTEGQNFGLAVDNVRITERSRVVLLEHFTNAVHNKSIAANETVRSLAAEKPGDIVFISYHTDFPSADPFNTPNKADPAARLFYYGISSIPYSVLDGGLDGSGNFDYTISEPAFNEMMIRALSDPGFSIEIDQEQADDQLNIQVDIASFTARENTDLSLHVAIVETTVDASVAGLQGDHVYSNVLRKMLPDAGGTQLPGNWNANGTVSYNFTWDIENVYDAENLKIIVFIQDEISGEITQTGSLAGFGVPVSVIPIPVQEPGEESAIGFYPNPVRDKLYIRINEPEGRVYNLEVFSITGNMVYSGIMTQTGGVYEFDARLLPRGTYIFAVKRDGVIKGSSRIVIMR